MSSMISNVFDLDGQRPQTGEVKAGGRKERRPAEQTFELERILEHTRGEEPRTGHYQARNVISFQKV